MKRNRLRIQEKSMLALVGYAVAEKEAVAAFMARFWDLDRGAIYTAGLPIQEVDQPRFCRQIAEVFHKVELYNDTIYNNIKIARPDASPHEIIEAADQAQVLNFAWELPKGMETRIGLGEYTLSQGEKQCLSIARALLSDAPIVLLDEVLASPKPERESAMQQAILHLQRTKTVVVVAQRLTTIQHADQILVVANDGIAEAGKHAQLMAQDGPYRKIWDIQQQYCGWAVH